MLRIWLVRGMAVSTVCFVPGWMGDTTLVVECCLLSLCLMDWFPLVLEGLANHSSEEDCCVSKYGLGFQSFDGYVRRCDAYYRIYWKVAWALGMFGAYSSILLASTTMRNMLPVHVTPFSAKWTLPPAFDFYPFA